MSDVSQAVLAAIAVLCFAIARPTHYRCEPGYYVEGVRPSGETRCVEAPTDRGDGECIAGGRCRFADTALSYPVQLYCTGGAHPIVVDERTVGCQR